MEPFLSGAARFTNLPLSSVLEYIQHYSQKVLPAFHEICISLKPN